MRHASSSSLRRGGSAQPGLVDLTTAEQRSQRALRAADQSGATCTELDYTRRYQLTRFEPTMAQRATLLKCDALRIEQQKAQLGSRWNGARATPRHCSAPGWWMGCPVPAGGSLRVSGEAAPTTVSGERSSTEHPARMRLTTLPSTAAFTGTTLLGARRSGRQLGGKGAQRVGRSPARPTRPESRAARESVRNVIRRLRPAAARC